MSRASVSAIAGAVIGAGVLSVRRVLGRYGTPARLRKSALSAIHLTVASTLGVAAAGADEITIAALGDSLTQGYGLPPDDGFVPQLEAWLRDRGHEVTVINAGVSGDTTAGGLARLGWTLTPDVDAVIVSLGGNDVLRGLPPEISRENLEGIMDGIAERGLPVLLAGLQAPGNYGAEYKAAFDAIYPELAAEHDAIHYTSFLSAIADAGVETAISLMQADGLHPNREGVARIVADIGPKVEMLVALAVQSEN